LNCFQDLQTFSLTQFSTGTGINRKYAIAAAKVNHA